MLKYFIFFSFLLVINLSIAISHDRIGHSSHKKNGRKNVEINMKKEISKKAASELEKPKQSSIDDLSEKYTEFIKLKHIIIKDSRYDLLKNSLKLEFRALEDLVDSMPKDKNFEAYLKNMNIKDFVSKVYRFLINNIDKNRIDDILNRIENRVHMIINFLSEGGDLDMAVNIIHIEYISLIRAGIDIIMNSYSLGESNSSTIISKYEQYVFESSHVLGFKYDQSDKNQLSILSSIHIKGTDILKSLFA